MRLHTLTLHAVGPFADEQVIDFDRLGAGGLFLFEGPTGVGKSTILDAITFALYGGLASASNDPARIRSDFVAQDVRPVVTFEFSVCGRRHRITRSPSFERPRQRGTGMTTEAASVHLQRQEDGAWTSLSHNKAEVGSMVGELLGLTQEQFRKVVLLPQGEFSAFLVAEERERAGILTTLFGTELFQRITDELRSRATQVRAAVREAEVALATRCAAAWEAAGAAPVEGVTPASLAGQVAELADLSEPIIEERDRAEALAEEAQVALRVAEESRRAAAEVLGAVQRHRALQVVRSTIERGRGEHDERVDRAELARQALPLRPLLDALDERSEQVAAARGAVSALGLDDEEHLPGRGHEALAAQALAAREAVARLEPAVAVEARLAGAAHDLALIETAAVRASDTLKEVEANLSELPAAVDAARTRAEQARSSASRVDLLAGQATAAAQQLALAEKAGSLAQEVTSAHVRQREAARSFQALDDEVRLLEDHRMENLSLVLAERLVSGDPCMVCGSVEHPSPAAGAADEITDEHLSARRAARDEARIVAGDAQLTLLTRQAELVAARAGIGAGTREEAQARVDEVALELASARSASERAPVLQAEVDRLAARFAELSDQRVRLASEVATSAGQAVVARKALESDQATVAAARGEHASVSARMAELGRLAERHHEGAVAVAALGAALVEHATLVGRVAAEAEQAGFDDETDLRRAVLSRPELEQLERAIRSWQRELDEVLADLAAPELVAVAEVGETHAVDADRQAEDARRQAAEAARSAQGVAATARQRADRFAQRLAEVQTAAERRAEVAAAADEVIALDDLARGQAGSPRMPLVHYVLRYWFEQVVDAANVRLAVMSTGKYQLLRTDSGVRKDAKVGLGLAVLDRHTGRERSPASLSGGERFYASLSLALGLADVVVAQAGGADLDTLFIDEGFGTMDADTLECVMSVIDDLRGNGRVVGIVSHVPDLKDRVPERLSIRRVTPEGPSKITVLA